MNFDLVLILGDSWWNRFLRKQIAVEHYRTVFMNKYSVSKRREGGKSIHN